MGSILGYAKGDAPFLRHFKRHNANLEANRKLNQWGQDLLVSNLVNNMPWWRKKLFRLGEILGNTDITSTEGYRYNGGKFGLLIRPAVNWVERQK